MSKHTPLSHLQESEFRVPEELEKEIKSKGLAFKWVNLTKLRKSHGFNKMGWKPYSISKNSKVLKDNPFMTPDVDGMFVRGDMVLAVKPEEEQAKYRETLKFYNDLDKNINRKHADELRETAKESGFRTEIDEGYGEE